MSGTIRHIVVPPHRLRTTEEMVSATATRPVAFTPEAAKKKSGAVPGGTVSGTRFTTIAEATVPTTNHMRGRYRRRGSRGPGWAMPASMGRGPYPPRDT